MAQVELKSGRVTQGRALRSQGRPLGFYNSTPHRCAHKTPKTQKCGSRLRTDLQNILRRPTGAGFQNQDAFAFADIKAGRATSSFVNFFAWCALSTGHNVYCCITESRPLTRRAPCPGPCIQDQTEWIDWAKETGAVAA